MGRLDKEARDKSAVEGEDDAFEGFETSEELKEIEDMEQALRGVHPSALGRTSRRKLEERLEDLRLQHQINDYDFKI